MKNWPLDIIRNCVLTPLEKNLIWFRFWKSSSLRKLNFTFHFALKQSFIYFSFLWQLPDIIDILIQYLLLNQNIPRNFYINLMIPL